MQQAREQQELVRPASKYSIPGSLINSLSFYMAYMPYICGNMYVCVYMRVCRWGQFSASQSSSTIWSPETQTRSWGLTASTFTRWTTSTALVLHRNTETLNTGNKPKTFSGRVHVCTFWVRPHNFLSFLSYLKQRIQHCYAAVGIFHSTFMW